MADKDVTEMLKIIIDNMATKDDLQKLETRMDARMKSLEYGMRSLEDSAISKILTHDDIEMITDRAANKALAVVENTLIFRGKGLFIDKGAGQRDIGDAHIADSFVNGKPSLGRDQRFAGAVPGVPGRAQRAGGYAHSRAAAQ